MPDLDHTALEAAARAATQDEWAIRYVMPDGTCGIYDIATADPEALRLMSGSGGARSWTRTIFDLPGADTDEANAAYIVAAQPSVILALLEERKRLVERVGGTEGLSRMVDHWRARATAAEAERDRLRAALAETAAQVIAEMVHVARAALAGEKEPTDAGA